MVQNKVHLTNISAFQQSEESLMGFIKNILFFGNLVIHLIQSSFIQDTETCQYHKFT